MPAYTAVISQVTTNGPYTYTIIKDGVGQKAAISLASIGAAMTAVQNDIGGLLGAETVVKVTINVASQ